MSLARRRVREAQEEGSGSLGRGRQKAVQVQQGLHRGLGGVPGQASSQARGSQSSQHAHGSPKAQPLPLRPMEPQGEGLGSPATPFPLVGPTFSHLLSIPDVPYPDLFLFSCPQYLHRFTWSHLSEHLAFERQVRRQRLRAEVAQAKRETDFYLRSVERGQRFLAAEGNSARPNGTWTFAQRPTEQELRARKAARPGGRERARLANVQDQARSNRGLLAKIFGAPPPSESMEEP